MGRGLVETDQVGLAFEKSRHIFLQLKQPERIRRAFKDQTDINVAFVYQSVLDRRTEKVRGQNGRLLCCKLATSRTISSLK
jgi:hypothetical protein